mgnify:CR=1 FL=1
MKHPLATTLRLARAGDLHAMALLSRDLIETGLAWRYTPRRMAELVADDDISAVVACEGSRLCGFGIMQFGDTHAHLVLLGVQAAQQRRGVGGQLHGWLLASARAAGMAAIGLELRADNPAALAFYRRLGYAELPGTAGYYDGRIAARRMRLVLRETPA